MEDDHESPPIIEDLMQRFYKCKYFWKLDLTAGYWQILLHKDSRKYTAFLFGTSMYQFTRVPFGLKTAGCAFIRALKIAYESKIEQCHFKFKNYYQESTDESTDEKEEMNSDMIHNNTSTYIDDIAIASQSFKKHIHILNIIFTKLLNSNFTIRLEKYEFFKHSIPFLGYIMSMDGIQVDPDRIKTIKDFEETKNQRQLQQILGICNYNRRFVINYSNNITPFRDLLEKNATWKWTENHTDAYHALKENFIHIVCLSHIIPGAMFKLQTDASFKVLYSSISHPQSNPTERVMREIGRLFRTYCHEKHTSWMQYVNTIENLLNSTTHYTTECTPTELHFGKPLHDEILKYIQFSENKLLNQKYLITFARKNIKKNFARRSKNQKISKVILKEGDYVLLRVRHLSNALDKVTKKFFHLFEGPYVINRVIGINAFALCDINDSTKEIGIYNRTNLRKYYPA